MAIKELPSPDLLKQVLRYEPETGRLFWLARPASMFVDGIQSAAHSCAIFNNRCANTEAFTAAHNRGYRQGRIFGVSYLAHRVIWAIQTGETPSAEIDHINGIKDDNRWSNLRAATHAQNMRNIKSRIGSTSIFLGVHWRKDCKKWAAAIRYDGHLQHLGYFSNETDAAIAYDKAAMKHFGDFARQNFGEIQR
jgi:hypothetical protein